MRRVIVAAAQSRNAVWVLWLLFTVAVSGVALIYKNDHTVTPAYWVGANRWFASEPLYDGTGHGFIYLPQAALTFAPLTLFPDAVRETLWRGLIIGVFAIGVARLSRLAGGDGRWFLLASVVAVPLAWQSARTGQAAVILTGLLILAAGDISEERWWRATWLLILALAFKPLALVLILLAMALHRPLWWRLPVGLMALALVPFVTQRSDYVISQYSACVDMLKTAFRQGGHGYWNQLFGMLKVAGWDVPSHWQQALRLLVAVLTLLGYWWATRRLTSARASFYLYAFTACYLMLFNPRNYGACYVMVAPVYGVALAEAWYSSPRRSAVIGLVVMIVGSLSSYELGKFLTPPPRAVWLSPLMCIGLTIYLGSRLIHESRSTAPETP